jgi:DNA repair exonuclease SbcCD ATPase subunit
MRLTLSNFKIWSNKEIHIPDTGITLLTGKSGAGKSSICDAIQYAIYGTGSKLVSHGESSCRVQLELDGLSITRSKRPNQLHVNGLTGAEAQTAIDHYFTPLFNLGGYVQQNATNSFVMMSPGDRLSVVEKVAFKTFDIETIHAKAKAFAKDMERTHIEATASLMTAEALLTETPPDPGASPPKPPGCKESIDLAHRKCVEERQEMLKKVERMREAEKKSRQYQKLEDLTTAIAEHEYAGDENLIRLEEIIEEAGRQTKRERLVQERDLLSTEKTAKLRALADGLWPDMTRQECVDMIESYREYIQDRRIYEKDRKKLAEMPEMPPIAPAARDAAAAALAELDERLRTCRTATVTHTCPHCENSVWLVDNRLVKEVASADELDSLTQKRRGAEAALKAVNQQLECAEKTRLERAVVLERVRAFEGTYEDGEDLEGARKTLREMEEYLARNTAAETEMRYIERDYETKRVQMSVAIDKIKCHQITVAPDERPLFSQCLRNPEDVEKELGRRRALATLYHNLVAERRRMEQELGGVGERVAVSEADLRTALDRVQGLTERCEEYSRQMLELERYNLYKERVDQRKRLVDRVENSRLDVDRALTRFRKAGVLRDKIRRAEAIYISKTIETIEELANKYIDEFFSGDMEARLSQYKEVKGKDPKVQVSLTVIHRDCEVDIRSLSGGERDRVVLAFSLALNEMLELPLSILDECTSSLDQENSLHIFGTMHKLYRTPCLVIAHQCVEGVFDHVIHV